jgi:hypothetical protein
MYMLWKRKTSTGVNSCCGIGADGKRDQKEGWGGGVLYVDKTGISGHFLDNVGGGGGADGAAGGVAVTMPR